MGHRWDFGRLVSAAAGVAAVVVAFLYTVGAVLVAGQLRTTGIPTRDVLPLVPLPQLLARGMSTLLASLAALVGFFVILAVLLGATWIFEHAVADPKAPSANAKRMVIGMLVLFSSVMVISSRPASALFAFAASVAVWFASISAMGRRPRSIAVAYIPLVVALALIMVAGLFDQYYYPPSLATVQLRRESAPVVNGKLIVATGTDYVVADGDRSMLVIPHDKVIEVHVTGGRSNRPQTIGGRVWHWIH